MGASTLAFWANLRYASGDPYGSLGLVRRALDNQHKITSGRVLAMLYGRQARAHSVAGESTAAYRAVDAALAAHDRSGPAAQDLPWVYWMTRDEIHEIAAYLRPHTRRTRQCAHVLRPPCRTRTHTTSTQRPAARASTPPDGHRPASHSAT
jgi:hypothetical protein